MRETALIRNLWKVLATRIGAAENMLSVRVTHNLNLSSKYHLRHVGLEILQSFGGERKYLERIFQWVGATGWGAGGVGGANSNLTLVP